MGDVTGIEWTDHTFNPWWGCEKVSPGCDNCYAEAWSKRSGTQLWGPTAPRRFFGEAHWHAPLTWNARAERAGIRARVFCASMGDVFEQNDDLGEEIRVAQDTTRDRLWDLIARTGSLDWMLLTKRPQHVRELMPERWDFLPRNVWLGVSVEDQARADERLPLLIQAPARTRFVSAEPLLGPVDLSIYMVRGVEEAVRGDDDYDAIDLVICGGESGGGSRPFDLAWARQLMAQCDHWGCHFFFKQAGATPLDGKRRLALLDKKKGGNLAELPTDLRRRDLPESLA